MPRNQDMNEQMRAESERKILDTALRLFAEQGYDNCSMNEIAKQAEMSKSNIYWYYPSKEKLFAGLLLDGFKYLGKIISGTASQSGSGIEKLEVFINEFLALMKNAEGEQWIKIVFTFIARKGTAGFAELGIPTNQIGIDYHSALNAIFKQCQAEGSIEQDTTPDLLSTWFFSFINGILLMYPDEWKDIPEHKIQKALLRLLGAKTIF